MDPHDPEVIAAARANGMHPDIIEFAQKSPVYKFVKEWGIALPPHLEYRTLPMLFYVPPMSPVLASRESREAPLEHDSTDLFHDIEQSRVPMKFLANLFGVGFEDKIRYALKKQKAVRWFRRAKTVGDVTMDVAQRMLKEADCTEAEAQEIFRMTALASFDERFVIPPSHREEAIQMMKDPQEHKQSAGFGFIAGPKRGF